MRTLLAEVVGDRDHSLAVEEIGGGPGDDINVGAVVDACLTPPFLIDRRVVVVREAGRLLTADVPRLVEVVKDPLPSTVLILVGGGGTVPAPLVKAVSSAGKVIDVSVSAPGTARPGCTITSAARRSSSSRRRPSCSASTWGRTSAGWRACWGPWPPPTARERASRWPIWSPTWARPGPWPATS